ncbi:MAG: SNF2-related protein [Betaproteobacteria bacterium]
MCSVDVEYAKELIQAGWRRGGDRFYTDDLQRVIPFIEHLSPELSALMEVGAAEYRESSALTPSDGFTAPVPDGLTLFPFQLAAVERILKLDSTLLAEDAGMGKEQPISEPVLTPSGFVPIGTIKVGDEIIARDGKAYRVNSVRPQGIKDVYKVEFTDGTWTRAGAQHHWISRDAKNDKRRHGADFWRVETTLKIASRVNQTEIPVCAPVQHAHTSLPIDPYTLGVLIGDGSLGGQCIGLTLHTSEDQIVQNIKLEGVRVKKGHTAGQAQQWRFSRLKGDYRNSLKEKLSSIGLNVSGKDKRIPRGYLTADYEQRVELLKGLMDTDGSVQVKPHGGVSTTFYTSAPGLADDVASLVRSLGGRAIINTYSRLDKGVEYVVAIHTNGIVPFKLERKRAAFRRQRPTGKYVKSIELIGKEESVCIGVDSPDNSYLTRDYIVTHNSAIMTTVANVIGAQSVLIVCPAIAKYNWLLKEWPKWSTLTHLSIDIAEGDYFPDTDVVIINYDILDRHKIKLQSRTWDFMIVDESHRIKNEEAKRTVMVLGGDYKVKKEQATISGAEMVHRGRYRVKGIPYKKRVFASATPMDKPADLWTMIQACDPKGLGADQRHFHIRYCAAYRDLYGWNVDGADNLDELGAILRSRFMIRHNPDDVLDLPPLTEPVVILPPIDIVSSEEEQFVRDNIDSLLDLAKEVGQPLSPEASTEDFLQVVGSALIDNLKSIGSPKYKVLFTQFALIRKNTGIAKVNYVAQFVDEVSQDGALPVVIFAYHRDVIEKLRERYPDAAYIMGGMPSKERNRQIDLFQNGDTNVFIGNIDAAGEAVTLTRANILVFAEMDWRATALIQARKRIHRISQVNPCTAYYLCAAQSFDYYVSKKAFRKVENIKSTLDF